MAVTEPSTRDLLQAAAKVCTEKQLEALILYESGASLRRIAATLGVTVTTVRDRIDAGLRKVQRELEAR